MANNKKPRAPYGSFFLTPEDIKAFRTEGLSARAIGAKRGASSSLVTYHLRKLNDPEIDAILKRNANRASDDYKENRAAKVDRMLKRGCSALDIITECHISTATLTKARKRLGLYDANRTKKKPGRPEKDGKPGSYHDLIADVVDTPVFTVLTKAWPVNLEYYDEEETA